MTTLSPLSAAANTLMQNAFSQLGSTNLALLIQVIEESTLLVNQLDNFVGQPGAQISFTTGVTSGDSNYFGSAPIMNVTGPITGTASAIVNGIVGTIAHEIGHFENSKFNSSLGIYSMPKEENPIYSLKFNALNQAQITADYLLSEGIAEYNNIIVANQISTNTGGTQQIGVQLYANAKQSQAYKNDVATKSQADVIAELANNTADSSYVVGASYLSNYWYGVQSSNGIKNFTYGGLYENPNDVSNLYNTSDGTVANYGVTIGTSSTGIATTMVYQHTGTANGTSYVYQSDINFSQLNLVSDIWKSDASGNPLMATQTVNSSGYTAVIHQQNYNIGSKTPSMTIPVATTSGTPMTLLYFVNSSGNQVLEEINSQTNITSIVETYEANSTQGNTLQIQVNNDSATHPGTFTPVEYITDTNGNKLGLGLDTAYNTTITTDSSGNNVATTQIGSGATAQAEKITVDNADDKDTILANGVTTTISNLEYLSYDASGNAVLDQDSTTSDPFSSVVSYTVGGVTSKETINANVIGDYTTDDINFENNTIAGDIAASGYQDDFGRTYTLSGTTLTITGKTAGDSLTISNFVNGDFGVSMNAFENLGALPFGATGINSAGMLIGYDVNAQSGFGNQGVLYNATTGKTTLINDPHAVNSTSIYAGTTAYAISDTGIVVGSYYDINRNKNGFTFNTTTGAYTTIDAPSAVNDNFQRIVIAA